MISYEELDRALARWKARSRGGVVDAPSAPIPVATDATPLPIPADELGSIPTSISPIQERTGEIDADELETYEES
jgi:hypothetical protein